MISLRERGSNRRNISRLAIFIEIKPMVYNCAYTSHHLIIVMIYISKLMFVLDMKIHSIKYVIL